MISRFFRPIKEGFYGVGRHAAMSISSASAVTITLLIISIFLIFSFNLQQFTKDVEQSVQIAVMIDYAYEEQSQMDKIGIDIGNIEGVSEVKFSSKEDEFQYYLDGFEDEAQKEVFEPFREDNPMHNAYYVSVEDGSNLKNVADQIAQIEGVDSIDYGGESAVVLVNALNSIRTGGGILAGALSLLAIFLIQNTIKLTIFARSDEIAIMRNVGAKNGFIRSPFLIEGIIIGILGSIIPIMLSVFGYIYLYRIMDGVIISKMFVMIPPHPFVLKIGGILLLIGMAVGLVGSFFSVNKYLRWKR
ncbi:MAG: permease-like cell division protein FtsX [Bacillota bacterium]|jgi:cell division transport system permease protein|nr:permease-like cell division protein FtsX [Bacillota bacterium]